MIPKCAIAASVLVLLGSFVSTNPAVAAANHAPVCPAKVLDMRDLPAGADLTSLNIDLINVAPICTDADGDELTVTSVSSLGVTNAKGAPAMKGSLKTGQSHIITFTVSDGKGGTVTSTLTIKR